MNDKQRRSKQEAAFFSECIKEGVAAEHALDYFERACNHFGTLFAPSGWLQPRRDALKEVLPAVISEDQAAGLRDVIYKRILLDSVIDWLKSGRVNSLTDVDRERRFQNEARRHISPRRLDPEKVELMFERVKQLAQKKREAEKESIQSSMQVLQGVLCERLKTESVSTQPSRAKDLLKHLLGGWKDFASKNRLESYAYSLALESYEWAGRLERDEGFSSSDIFRATDTIARLLSALSALEAHEVAKIRDKALTALLAETAYSARPGDFLVEEIEHVLEKELRSIEEALQSIAELREEEMPGELPMVSLVDESVEGDRHGGSAVSSKESRVKELRSISNEEQPPMRAPAAFSENQFLIRTAEGELVVSDGLVELLVQSREAYCWNSKNKGKGPCSDNEREVSQREVLQMEEAVAALVADLNPESAYMIALKVYEWGGGRGERPARGDGTEFEKAIRMLLAKEAATGLELLTTQRRIDLVMATKVYRFCCPKVGAAVDRHASYFF